MNVRDAPTPLADLVRRIASHLIEDCRLAIHYEAMLLDVADTISVLEREYHRLSRDE